MFKCVICGFESEKVGSHLWFRHNISMFEYLGIFLHYSVLEKYQNGMGANQIAKDVAKLGVGIKPSKKDVLAFLHKQSVEVRNTSQAIKVWSDQRGGPWNKGKTKFDHPSIMKYAESRRGENNPIFSLTPDKMKKHINTLIENTFKSTKNKNTSIERIVQKLLVGLNIEFQTQVRLGNRNFIYDFYLPSFDLIIECNGDYFHANPLFYEKNSIIKLTKKTAGEVWKYDKEKIEHACLFGCDVLVLWENEINKLTKERFKQKLYEVCKNKKDLPIANR